MWHYIVMALGWIIKTIYDLVQNYGVAIILFTIVVKLLLLPLNIKSQKAMKKQQKIQPIVAELQKKYANDQQKLQQEMMKVYKENNVSMAGGCLPMLIQMPILVALYQAIQKPLTYMFNVPYKNIPSDVVNKVVELAEKAGEKVTGNAEQFVSQLMSVDQIKISSWAGQVEGKLHEWYINFNFLGLDLSKKPQNAIAYLSDPMANLSVVLLLLIPILAIVSSFLQSKITMKQSGQDKNSGTDQAQSMNAMMKWMMPIMSGYFALILPAGIGLYWIVSGVVQIIQQLALNNYFEKKGEDFVVKVPEKRYQHGKKGKKY
ncbi:MAG: YidC/Oxa1 family membrane protein insertase [Clostridiales bacterium]|nr:YidC/Oxa1 family membrane protein insertase [Clostridiales bacterium]